MTPILPESVVDGDYEPKFQGFLDLMPNRVQEILLVATYYDSFILEEDGQLTERIFGEYVSRNLRYAPRITRVSTASKALERLEESGRYDLVVTMMRLPDMDVFEFSKAIKRWHADLPVILLAHDKPDLEAEMRKADRSCIDYALVWSGDTRILLTGIKLVEDALNVDHDIEVGNLRVIIIVEDSVRYASLILPFMFTALMRLTQSLLEEGLNDMHRFLRMRARPKVLLAQDYETAIALYRKYRKNVLGVISDIRFPHGGEIDSEAGFSLISEIKAQDPDMRCACISYESENESRAQAMNITFIDKTSPTLQSDLNTFARERLGFGEFVFRMPDGRETDRASNLQELQEVLERVPIESVVYHSAKNHFSNWLMARTEFTLAEKIRPKEIKDFADDDAIRSYLVQSIRQHRKEKQQGIIADFSKGLFKQEDVFLRFGGGSIGGKARGIAFIGALLARKELGRMFPGIRISIPRTAVACTDYFDRFLEKNGLADAATGYETDLEIAARFLRAKLPGQLVTELTQFIQEVDYPIAVRSSSLLEDSQDQPLAGIYATYMLPNNHQDAKVRLEQLFDAIKLVYASTFFKAPRAYLASTPSSFHEEKMAVIIQQLIGRKHNDRFYPSFAGVTQSYNFYPVRYMKPDDGIASVVLGLGQMVMEGGKALRFCPNHPGIVPQLSVPSQAMDTTQRSFYALDLANPGIGFEENGLNTLVEYGLETAEEDGTLPCLASVLSPEDDTLRDGLFHKGPRVVTFAHILKSKAFPLADILGEFMRIGSEGMGCPVEIEFAATLSADNEEVPEFTFLQIRPMVVGMEGDEIRIDGLDREAMFARSTRALGNGKVEGIRDVLYVPPGRFDAAKTVQIADEIGRMNEGLAKLGSHYVLIGPGRWGTVDRWLGIPVRWEQISQVKVMVETALENFRIEPSQGSHFFHNVTSFRIGYLTVGFNRKDEFVDWDWLDQFPAEQETDFVRHIRLPEPLEVRIDGKQRAGALLKNQ